MDFSATPREVLFTFTSACTTAFGDGKMRWIEVSAGDLVEVPSSVKHALRNRSQYPVINLVFTTSKHGPAASRD